MKPYTIAHQCSTQQAETKWGIRALPACLDGSACLPARLDFLDVGRIDGGEEGEGREDGECKSLLRGAKNLCKFTSGPNLLWEDEGVNLVGPSFLPCPQY